MLSLETEFDHCWTLFSVRFPELSKPTMKVTKMTACWGKCYYTQNKITLASRLESCPQEFAHHVIFHECCHLIHPNHSRAFYDLLQQFDPMERAHGEQKQQRLARLQALVEGIVRLNG